MTKCAKRTCQILSCIGLIPSMSVIAQASAITDNTPFSGNDSINWGNYGSGLGSSVTSGSTILTAASQTVTISFSDGSPGLIYEENPNPGTYNFQGGFSTSPSPYLLNTNDFLDNPDQLTLTFSTPISEFGVYVEAYDYTHDFSISLTSNDGSTTNTVGPTSGAPCGWV